LHLGHARTFWIAHERARERGGKLWLRDEDLDPHRSRAEFSQAMRDDLRWLGISWDEELTQSVRLAAYRDAVRRLLHAGLIYPCTCSRKDLAHSIGAPHDDTDDEPVYDGRCRGSLIEPDDVQLTPITNYRFMVPHGEAIEFADGQAGPQRFVAAKDFGDFVVWRKDGLPSYQLACVVDDAAMGITEVVRGRDLLKSTARQMLLQRALGLATPAYFHCDLMRDAAGKRLAKRHDALAIRTLREQGRTPEEVRALLQL
jgi:glutamyl-tRNA synthetase